MPIENEETIEIYKDLSVTPVGIPKDEVPHQAKLDMTDAELVAFYSEQYVDVDVADFLMKERRERLYGLCNLVQPGEFCLDVGCANGAHMEILHQRGISTVGLDLSIPNILRGRERYPHLKFVHGFAEEIPFKDNYFDIVLLGDVIEHFRNPQTTLAECLRVAKKGLALCVPIKEELTAEHIKPFSYEAILELLQLYKLKLTFSDYEGTSISQSEAASKLKTFPWLIVLAEKTNQTNGIVKEIAATDGKKLQRQAMAEILNKDQWYYDVEHKRDETEVARFKLLSHLVEGQKVLEIGCGNGDLSIEVAKEDFDVVGVDISEAGIKQASEKARNEGLDSRAKFLVMDATNLDFPDNSFDSVLIVEVFEHVRSSRDLLKEAVRVVRNGGRVVVSVPDGLLVPWQGHLRVFFKDTLANELSQYAGQLEWHEMLFKRWLICSFFVRKKNLDITKGLLIDIMMPTYNGRKHIKRAIESVISQTYQNWNLVIINDGGENIEDIIQKFEDDRIKYLRDEHKGKAHALNVGIKNSEGQYIAYLDDDDVLYPMHLEVLLKSALEQQRDFIYCDWYEVSIDENDREIGREFDFREDVTPRMLICQNYINHKCVLHKRSLLKKSGMYDEKLDMLIDWDMIRRLSFVCKPYHVWSVTSEHIRYYNKDVIENRIAGLWSRDPDKAGKSIERIVRKTTKLPATMEDLKEAIVKAMLSWHYYHHLELGNAMQAKDSQISELGNDLLAKDSQISELGNDLQTKDSQIQQIQSGIVMQLLSKYQRAVEKVLRSGTRRRYYYELGLTGIRVILNEGWRSFARKVWIWFRLR